jgi:general secretion pathway protein C
VRLRVPALLSLVALLACDRAAEGEQAAALQAATAELAAARAAFESDRAAMQQELAALRKAVDDIDAKLAAQAATSDRSVPSTAAPRREPSPEALSMSLDSGSPSTPEEDPLSSLVRCASPERCKIERAFWNDLRHAPERLMKQARVVPKPPRDGRPQGFKLYGIRRGSLPKAVGLENGDLVRSVNGKALGSLDDTMAILSKLGDEDTFTLELERRGTPLTLTLEVVDHL